MSILAEYKKVLEGVRLSRLTEKGKTLGMRVVLYNPNTKTQDYFDLEKDIIPKKYGKLIKEKKSEIQEEELKLYLGKGKNGAGEVVEIEMFCTEDEYVNQRAVKLLETAEEAEKLFSKVSEIYKLQTV